MPLRLAPGTHFNGSAAAQLAADAEHAGGAQRAAWLREGGPVAAALADAYAKLA